MSGRHVICALGNWESFEGILKIIEKFEGFELDLECSSISADPRMERSFNACIHAEDPWEDIEFERIRQHTAVAYITTPYLHQSTCFNVAFDVLLLIGDLFANANALAIKNESSGLAHPMTMWMETAMDAIDGFNSDGMNQAVFNLLADAFVKHNISDGDYLYSCGMHLLGFPEVKVDCSVGVDITYDCVCNMVRYMFEARSKKLEIQLGQTVNLGGNLFRISFGTSTASPDDARYNSYGFVVLNAVSFENIQSKGGWAFCLN